MHEKFNIRRAKRVKSLNRAPLNRNEVLNEYVFYNGLITINNKLLCPKDFGLDPSVRDLRIVDIIGNNNKFLTPQAFRKNCKARLIFCISTRF